jgi:hypothetical protein
LSSSFHHSVDVNCVRPLTIKPNSHLPVGNMFQFSFSVKSHRTLRKSQILDFFEVYLLDILNSDRQCERLSLLGAEQETQGGVSIQYAATPSVPLFSRRVARTTMSCWNGRSVSLLAPPLTWIAGENWPVTGEKSETS